jgi:hypothetical protein
MLDVADVAPVATVAKPASPNKPALDYLRASGARAISIIADVDGAAIKVGMKPDALAIFWLPETQRRRDRSRPGRAPSWATTRTRIRRSRRCRKRRRTAGRR